MNLEKLSIGDGLEVYSLMDQREAYFSVIENKKGTINLYYNNWGTCKTKILQSKNGLRFEAPNKHLIISKSGATHNFYVFYDKDGNYRALGGMDLNRKSRQWHKLCSRAGTRSFQHTKGLYLFKSTDGINWENANEKEPVIRIGNENFVHARTWKSSEFDSHFSVVYNKKQDLYFFYGRANIDRGTRFIQYATSKDLFNWSRFELLKLKFNPAVDNYYYPVMFPDPSRSDVYLGLLPYFNKKHCMIKLVESTNCVNWKLKKNLFVQKVVYYNKKQKASEHPVSGVVVRGKKAWIYIHHNYKLLRPTMSKSFISRYEVTL